MSWCTCSLWLLYQVIVCCYPFCHDLLYVLPVSCWTGNYGLMYTVPIDNVLRTMSAVAPDSYELFFLVPNCPCTWPLTDVVPGIYELLNLLPVSTFTYHLWAVVPFVPISCCSLYPWAVYLVPVSCCTLYLWAVVPASCQLLYLVPNVGSESDISNCLGPDPDPSPYKSWPIFPTRNL
jgi:hypothetical protein